jgi:hypothetical protein
MSESDSTGYRESPDTTDGPTNTDMVDGAAGETDDVTLTTDDDAQRDDGLIRPGNAPD